MTHSYDLAGNVLSVNESYGILSSRFVNNTYDNVYRLTYEDISGGYFSETQFGYDQAHNLAAKAMGGPDYPTWDYALGTGSNGAGGQPAPAGDQDQPSGRIADQLQLRPQIPKILI